MTRGSTSADVEVYIRKLKYVHVSGPTAARRVVLLDLAASRLEAMRMEEASMLAAWARNGAPVSNAVVAALLREQRKRVKASAGAEDVDDGTCASGRKRARKARQAAASGARAAGAGAQAESVWGAKRCAPVFKPAARQAAADGDVPASADEEEEEEEEEEQLPTTVLPKRAATLALRTRQRDDAVGLAERSAARASKHAAVAAQVQAALEDAAKVARETAPCRVVQVEVALHAGAARRAQGQRNIIALHFHYGLSQLMLYPVVCARTFQSARCELLVPNQHSPGE